MSAEIAQAIDWSRPLVAVPAKKYREGPIPRVAVDRTYHRKPNYVPVRFDRNIWTNTPGGGTWHFTDDGLAIAGCSPDGYDGMFTVANA